MNKKISKEEINEIVKADTLKTFNIISDNRNYSILSSLPATAKQISQLTDISEIVIEMRMKKLMKAFLVEKDISNPDIYNQTLLSKNIILLMNYIMNIAEQETEKALKTEKAKAIQ